MCGLVSSGVGPFYNTLPPSFLIPNSCFRILGALVISTSFVESFVVEVFHEDIGMMFSLLMVANPRVAFVMFLSCYAQCSNYLFHTIFPSPDILQYYVEFNIHTMATLEKLFSEGSFGGSIIHLAHC
jgi:hypothetical protein